VNVLLERILVGSPAVGQVEVRSLVKCAAVRETRDDPRWFRRMQADK